MNHLSLFSGSGIGSLAAAACGIRTVAHAENDPACCYCLERLWPDTYLFRDVRDVTAESIRRLALGEIDIISGGFPCQDLSTAGRGAGIEGSRSGLWREMFRVISEVRPRWILVENVPAIKVRGIDRVLAPLARIGYTCWPCVVGAWAVGAPHKRDRVWIVARYQGDGRGQGRTRGSDSSDQGQREFALQDRLANAAQQRRRQGRREPINSNDNRTGKITRGGEETGLADPVGNLCGSGDARQDAGGDSGGELVDALPDGLRIGRGTAAKGTLQRCDRPVRWPSRPGEPQHAWEAPRLVEFGLGDATDGMARRVRSRVNKAALRMVGNGWVYPIAEMMFRAITELENQCTSATS
jgi:DNA (cytosine-5)-methyltransferase 1